MKGLPFDSVQRASALYDAMVDPVYVIDREKRVLYFNRAFLQYSRLSARRIEKGAACHECIHLAICRTNCIADAAWEAGRPVRWREIEGAGRDDERLSIAYNATPVVGEDGGIAGAVLTIRDLSAEDSMQSSYKVMYEQERQAKEALARANEEIRRWNLELEEKVQARTAELASSRKEVLDILENIRQAIFTVNPQLAVNNAYSRFVEEAYGTTRIAGRPFVDLLCPEDGGAAEARAELQEWLDIVFDKQDLGWDTISELAPIAFDYRTPGGADRKFKMEYRPILESGRMVSLMVITQDVTETEALKGEVRAREKENEDNLEQVAEIIRLDRTTFRSFVMEGQEAVRAVEEGVATLRDEARDRTGDGALVDRMFREAHSLKGNARFFELRRIEQLAHELEDAMDEIRRGGAPLDAEHLDRIYERLIALADAFRKIVTLGERILSGGDAAVSASQYSERRKEYRYEVGDGRIRAVEARVVEGRRLAEAEAADGLAMVLAGVERDINGFRTGAVIRLLRRYPSMVRDLAVQLGRKVNDLIIEGGKVEIDVRSLDRLKDPMVHLLRNALDHGVEMPEVRREVGKPEFATIQIIAREVDHGRIEIVVADDGRGMDPEVLKSKAVEKGVIEEAEARRLTREEALGLIFRPGFSSAGTVSTVSGRGVGMDLVKNVVEEMGGHVGVESEVGRGTRITLDLPRLLAPMPAKMKTREAGKR